ncbi:MAG: PAS domain-containing sensor histidine kinase, partial [Acidobacteria bacterium]
LFIDITKTERLEQIRRNFISDFSHEVRTPLAGLRSAVETFDANAGRLSSEDDQQLRRIMSRQLRRLERLVEDLSELSRIEAGDVALEFRSIDLRRMLDDLCEDFADQAAHHRVRFAVEGNSVVCGDVLRLQQAFSNLLDNAIKYGADDGQVEVKVIDEPDAGVVRIADHGDGIPESERSKIFRRFYRIDKSRSQEIPGTGLGLAITKHLVLQHGGTIDVESEPGKGATFIVRLPKRIANPAPPAEASR